MSSRKTVVSSTALALLSAHSLAVAGGPAVGAKGHLLGDFSTETVSEAEFAAEYFGKTYGNASNACPACAAEIVSTNDATGDFARLKYSLAASGVGTYFANVGLMLPLDNLWSSANDLRSMTKVWFKARTSSAYPDGIILKVNFDSPAFPFGSAGYTRLKTVNVTNDWTWYSIAIKEFAYASWMKTDAAAATKKVIVIDNLPGGGTVEREAVLDASAVTGKLLNSESISDPDYDNDAINALKHIKMIQFGIDPAYTSTGAALLPDYAQTNAPATLDIDSVFFEGAEVGWVPPVGTNCTGDSFSVVEDFNPQGNGKAGIGNNYLGGYWFAYSDTSTDPSKTNPVLKMDSAVGISSVAPLDPNDPQSVWGINDQADVILAEMVATLNKGDAAKHPYAGWAELGTSLAPKEKAAAGRNLSALKAIRFGILAGGSDPFNTKFDKAKLKGVTVKLAKASVGDSAAFSARIPFDQINAMANNGEFVNVCLDLSSFKQPAWYTQKYGTSRLTSDSLTQISWNLAIQDNKDVAAATSIIQVKDLRFYGSAAMGVKGGIGRQGKAIRASYRNGLTLGFAVMGTQAKIEIVRMDGSVVATFSAPAQAKALNLPLQLSKGTYMVVVRGDRETLTKAVPVLEN